jgi:hypothetical protein
MLLGVGKVKVNVEEVIDWIDCNKELTESKDYEDEVDNDSGDDDETLETHTQIRVKDESAIKSLNVVLKWTAENDVALTDIRRLQKLKEMAFQKYHHRTRQTTITQFFKSSVQHNTK